MHPVISQAVAAERRKDLQARAAARQRASDIGRPRRAQQARRPWPVMPRPVRAPRAA